MLGASVASSRRRRNPAQECVRGRGADSRPRAARVQIPQHADAGKAEHAKPGVGDRSKILNKVAIFHCALRPRTTTALIVASNSISVYGPPLFDVSACCPRYTVGQIVARVTFTDRNGNNGVAET